jgi:hypothetical protein
MYAVQILAVGAVVFGILLEYATQLLQHAIRFCARALNAWSNLLMCDDSLVDLLAVMNDDTSDGTGDAGLAHLELNDGRCAYRMIGDSASGGPLVGLSVSSVLTSRWCYLPTGP